MSRPPNILFIFTDQQSAHMMSCAGNRYLSTPAMDSLAAEGVRFERAYCANPVCVASRFSLMTGRLPGAVGLYGNSSAHIAGIPEPIRRQSFGHRMRAAGYNTVHAGKVHLPKMSAEDIGFDVLCDDDRDQLADACAEFLPRSHDRPFCLVASFINPHDICYMAIRDFQRSPLEKRLIDTGVVECAELDAALRRPPGVDEETFFERHCPPLPANFEVPPGEAEAVDIMLSQRPFRIHARQEWSQRRWREHRWAYARLTERVDAQIGRVLEALRRSGRDRDTLIIFSSDHGDLDASHRLEHKSALYEESIHIPLIIRPPGQPRAGRVDSEHVVSNGLDILPTCFDYAGVHPAPDAPGQSLRPLVENPSAANGRQYTPVEAATGRTIITSRYKYTRHEIGRRAEQLVDLQTDPGEMKNLADDPGAASILEEMRSAWHSHFGHQPRDAESVMTALI